jgi:hypothetical protein
LNDADVVHPAFAVRQQAKDTVVPFIIRSRSDAWLRDDPVGISLPD